MKIKELVTKFFKNLIGIHPSYMALPEPQPERLEQDPKQKKKKIGGIKVPTISENSMEFTPTFSDVNPEFTALPQEVLEKLRLSEFKDINPKDLCTGYISGKPFFCYVSGGSRAFINLEDERYEIDIDMFDSKRGKLSQPTSINVRRNYPDGTYTFFHLNPDLYETEFYQQKDDIHYSECGEMQNTEYGGLQFEPYEFFEEYKKLTGIRDVFKDDIIFGGEEISHYPPYMITVQALRKGKENEKTKKAIYIYKTNEHYKQGAEPMAIITKKESWEREKGQQTIEEICYRRCPDGKYVDNSSFGMDEEGNWKINKMSLDEVMEKIHRDTHLPQHLQIGDISKSKEGIALPVAMQQICMSAYGIKKRNKEMGTR